MHTFKDLQKKFIDFSESYSFSKSPEGLYDPVDYIMGNKGKQIRPILLLLAHGIYQKDIERVLPAAYAIELFHSFSLLHDDVMDEADVRRGEPTVHVKYGVNTAILSGDVMLIYVYKLLSESIENKYLPEVLSVFNKVAIEVCEGQQMDMDFENRSDVAIEDYIRMIGLKTAVLLAGALKIGAITGGATNADAERLYEFGKNIGLAFQIQDDLLDTFGDQETFGKKIGGDIMQNKKTYLYLRAKEKATSTDLELLNSYFDGSAYEESEKIAAVTDIFKRLEVNKMASELKEKYQRIAFEKLAELSCDPQQTEPLRKLAEGLMGRTM
ncbi:MAG: polyprenyl synthetase family protein [Saprospiraceae bacterium]